MTGRGPDTDHGRIAEEAAAWFVRLQGETATGDDWLAFERWLASSPAHALAYERLEALSVELDEAAAPLIQALDAPTPITAAVRRRPPTRSWLWPALGAPLAAGLAVVVWLGAQPRPQPPVIYQTAPGQVCQLALADGSKVRMNAASRLQVRLTRRDREVQMADGEAAIDVAHDTARPFLIQVGDRQVRVVGTEFDLRHRNGETRLTVRRGVVEVRPADAPDATPARVTVGEQLVHRDGEAGSQLAAVVADDAFGWTTGQLVYRDRPLSEVAADLSRRFARPIRTADAETGAIRFTGVLVTDNEAAVLRRLEAFSGVKAEFVADGVVLRRSRR
jgi:transmembrane sensor